MYNSNLELLTVSELCDILNISSNTAYALLNSSKIEALRIGRHWKIPLSSVETFIITNSKMVQTAK